MEQKTNPDTLPRLNWENFTVFSRKTREMRSGDRFADDCLHRQNSCNSSDAWIAVSTASECITTRNAAGQAKEKLDLPPFPLENAIDLYEMTCAF
jgi:hypothetical protein